MNPKLEEEIKWFNKGDANCGDRTAALVRSLIDERKKLLSEIKHQAKLIEAYEEQALEDGHD